MPANTTTLDKLKVLLRLSGTGYDDLLSQILEVCEGDFCALTHRTEVPDAAENVVLRMAMVRWTTLSSEGLSSISLDGLNESFTDYGYLTSQINGYRKAVML